ncbi:MULTISPECIES: hypothetical protein [unclassified Nostoc]|uniref:hypothetical protein n=1 Tax=unclassified Nostoc TaxID=2593658 RepID=UPI00260C52D8|nr:hypothetical protein [Nostoc sp. S13]MDF5739148.1 hypothetical protein [Nostoc sp. S13]
MIFEKTPYNSKGLIPHSPFPIPHSPFPIPYQYGSVKARDAINRRLYNNQSFVETAIYRVFAI